MTQQQKRTHFTGPQIIAASCVSMLLGLGLAQGEISKGIGLFAIMLFLFSMMGLILGALVWMVMGISGDDE